MRKSPRFFVGTAGWSYLQWDKEFYPHGLPTAGKLGYYATQFNAVELNNSFYHTPSPDQIAVWEDQVPKSFHFATKASRYITHVKKLNEADITVPPFVEALNGQNKAGPVFFQLPPTLPKNLARLNLWLHALPLNKRYSIELRHPSWHDDEVYKLLAKHNVAFCLYDTVDTLSPRIKTADFTYVRLRGRESNNPEDFLRGWHDWLCGETSQAWVFFDNREQKNLAFGNALRFRDLVAEAQGGY